MLSDYEDDEPATGPTSDLLSDSSLPLDDEDQEQIPINEDDEPATVSTSGFPSEWSLPLDTKDNEQIPINAENSDPLLGYSHAELEQMGEDYARTYQHETDPDAIRLFRKAAVLAQNTRALADLQDLTEAEQSALRKEILRPWEQPKMVKSLYIVCACAVWPTFGKRTGRSQD